MHFTSILLPLMVISLATVADNHSCQQGWKYHGGSCFKGAGPKKLALDSAYNVCRGLGASKLITPTSKLEKEFLQEAFRDEFSSSGTTYHSRQVWLGCNALDGDVCSTGATLNELEINNLEICYTVSFVSLKLFENSCNSDKKRAICEKSSKPLHSLTIANQDALTTPGCLLRHAYRKIPLLHPIQCYFACYKDPNCLSFNLSGKFCQLNNATISQVETAKFVTTAESCANYNLN